MRVPLSVGGETAGNVPRPDYACGFSSRRVQFAPSSPLTSNVLLLASGFTTGSPASVVNVHGPLGQVLTAGPSEALL